MGGRGASSSIPVGHLGGGSGGGNAWSNGLGFKNYNTLKEALGEKGKPMTMAKAVLGANPHYDKTGTYKEFTENCQRSVVAMEARRRGYDVTAQPTYKNDKMGAVAYENPRTGVRNNYWMGAFKNAKPEAVGKNTAIATQKNIEQKMAKYGNGSRAIMQVKWNSANGGGGHVLSIEQRNGKTLYLDAQAGTRYSPKELFSAIDTKRTQITRVDNLKFSDRAKKMITKDKW